MRHASKSAGAQITRHRGRLRCRIVWIPKFDGFVTGARQQFPFRCPANTLHHILMSLGIPNLFSSRQVPDLHHTITTATGKALKRAGILGHTVDTIHMAVAHLTEEWCSKHTLHLDRIQGTSIFSSPLKRMLSRVEIPRLANGRRPWGLLRCRGARKGFDFLKLMSIKIRQIGEKPATYHGVFVKRLQRRRESGLNFFSVDGQIC